MIEEATDIVCDTGPIIHLDELGCLDLLAGKKVEMPPIRQVGATFKKAPKAMEKQSGQSELQM